MKNVETSGRAKENGRREILANFSERYKMTIRNKIFQKRSIRKWISGKF